MYTKERHPAHQARLDARNRAKNEKAERIKELVRTGVGSDNPAFQKAWDSLPEADRQVLLHSAGIR